MTNKIILFISGILIGSVIVIGYFNFMGNEHDNSQQEFAYMGKNAYGYDEYLHNQTSLVFIHLPGGLTEIGTKDDDFPDADLHKVTLKDFYISKYEITQEVWQEIMGYNPSWMQKDKGFTQDTAKCPVENVSWNECMEFCNKTGLQNSIHSFQDTFSKG